MAWIILPFYLSCIASKFKQLINKNNLWLFMIHFHRPHRFSFNSLGKRPGSEFQTKPITPNTNSTVFQPLNPVSLCQEDHGLNSSIWWSSTLWFPSWASYQMCSLLRIGHYHRQIQSVSRAVNVISVKFVFVFVFLVDKFVIVHYDMLDVLVPLPRNIMCSGNGFCG